MSNDLIRGREFYRDIVTEESVGEMGAAVRNLVTPYVIDMTYKAALCCTNMFR